MAPTASAAAEQPVPEWRRGSQDETPETKVSEHKVSCEKRVMSDADTESSGGPWSQVSITSSESDGPRIVVHSTSEDEEQDTVRVAGMLHLATGHSLTTTDVGSDYTSEGGECGREVDPAALTPDLLNALVRQLEEYLSDDGLTKDLFLLKHVKRHRDGFVSLKLLSGYKKIKKLSRNWRWLAAAARTSAALQVNEEGSKVRRTAPLPPRLLWEVPTSRTLLAVNVPAHHATMANLAVLFGTYGAVASLQVVRPKPGGGVHPDLQYLLPQAPEVSNTTCAVVEYEDMWGAARALHDLDDPHITLHVLRRSRRTSPASSRTSPTPKGQRTRNESGVSADELRQRLKGGRYRLSPVQRESSASDGEDSPSRRSWWQQRPRHLTPQPSPRPTHRWCSFSTPSSPAAFRRAQYHQQQHHHHHQQQHHYHHHQQQQYHHHQHQQYHHHQQQQQPRVTRSPRGPDGTRGFTLVRS
ncbi:uncharacterized protein [Panulirus ornatus]|uniref:uncharacterized protein n=1 Tax=Panulirus ornatus TaxID=150431 RepID=UPI003A8AC47F